MAFVATCNWVDLQDNRHRYLAGDKFPREGLAVPPARIAYLAGTGNLAHKPLIRADGEGATVSAKKQPVKATKTPLKAAEKADKEKSTTTRKTGQRAKKAVKNDA